MVSGASYIHLNTSLFSLRVPKMGKKLNFYPFQGKGTVIWDYLRGVSFAAVSWGTCNELLPQDWYLACLQVVTDYQTFWQYAVFELFYGKGKVVRSSFMRIYFEGTSLSSSFRQRFSTIKRVGEFRLALNWQFDYIFCHSPKSANSSLLVAKLYSPCCISEKWYWYQYLYAKYGICA